MNTIEFEINEAGQVVATIHDRQKDLVSSAVVTVDQMEMLGKDIQTVGRCDCEQCAAKMAGEMFGLAAMLLVKKGEMKKAFGLLGHVADGLELARKTLQIEKNK